MSINLLLATTVLINYLLVTTSRAEKAILLAAVQGILLGLVLFSMHTHWAWHVVAMAVFTILIKGVAIPAMLSRAQKGARDLPGRETFLGYTLSLVLLAAGTGLSLILAERLPLRLGTEQTLFVPASLTTLFTGFLLLAARRRALIQVVGYLVLENGVFLFGLLLVKEMPLLVETGVLLDLVVGIFVMGVVINHIQQAFETQDTGRMSRLKD